MILYTENNVPIYCTKHKSPKINNKTHKFDFFESKIEDNVVKFYFIVSSCRSNLYFYHGDSWYITRIITGACFDLWDYLYTNRKYLYEHMNKKREENNTNKLRVWWIPQVGASEEAFYIPVNTVEDGKKIMDMLSAYDAYQLQNRIKPDYCNTGGIQIWNEEESECEDWYLETEDDYFDDVNKYCEQCERANELKEFKGELFKQINWNKIQNMIN